MLLKSGSGSGPSGGAALPELHRRLRWVALAGIGAFFLLAGRLWQLQVMNGEGYFERTVSNVVKERYLSSVRGKILDRTGVPIADNRPAFNIYLTPGKADQPQVARDEIVRLLGLSGDEIEQVDQRLAIGRKRDPKKPMLVLEDQGRDRAALVEQALARLPGVEVHHEPYRFYPQGDIAAHLVGYMTQMTADEADRMLANDTSELVGRYGLEAAWENYLRGKKGIERFAVDARGQRLDEKTAATLIEGERVTGAVPGANLVLTIDLELQKLAEKAIKDSRVPAAAVIMVEPKTGKVRALVSRPSFDPNVMTGHLTRQEYEMLRKDPRKPFVDKALRATYAPGSVFKFVAALAALEDGLSADETHLCQGYYELSGTTFKCNGTHGKQDLIGAIQHSCNIYFWKLAESIGLDRIAEVARLYGFGAPTNLGLNGDGSGRIPTKAWYEQRTKYKVGYATNAATGQGDVEVTVLQMAMAYAALANGGTLYVPQVVERVEASNGQTINTYQPTVARQLPITADSLDIWHKGMWKVTNQAGGTAFDHGFLSTIRVFGKTGTAEIRTRAQKKGEDERDIENWNPRRSHAWFAGWVGDHDPEIAIVVFVEHGGSGGRVAWPIAKQILEGYAAKRTSVAAPAGDSVKQPLLPSGKAAIKAMEKPAP
ncbi:MAG: penicillin-binding protein 2 [Deltaproteobacteria bacterium]|nr:penicillin-binding protein 2 [Deltaproteobacteria bacterium]